MKQDAPTRTQATEAAYLKTASKLAARYEASEERSWDQAPLEFVNWLAGCRGQWTPSTWRQYKASVLHWLDVHRHPEAREQLAALTSETCRRRARSQDPWLRTSARKAKSLPPADMEALHDFMGHREGIWDAPVMSWLEATLLTGLRPSEWMHAELFLEDEDPRLVVLNAKHTNGRAHGELRTLHLRALPPQEMEIIRSHLAYCHEQRDQGLWDAFYSGCRGALYSAGRTLWPRRRKRPTLYSARHQFAANAKAAGFSRREIAAMMGHAVDDTATSHYGRRRSGTPGRVLIIPNAGDVERVIHVDLPRFFQEAQHQHQDQGPA